MAWSYFHKLYEAGSVLSRNFLLIAPNIIVLDRLHIQDDVRIVRPTGNIFLTNIHRVYLGNVPEPSLER